jgi:hypothetical protein
MARRGDVRRPPSDALFAFPCRLRRIRRIKALHITKQNIILIVWRRLCKATNSFLQKKKKNTEWWLAVRSCPSPNKVMVPVHWWTYRIRQYQFTCQSDQRRVPGCVRVGQTRSEERSLCASCSRSTTVSSTSLSHTKFLYEQRWHWREAKKADKRTQSHSRAFWWNPCSLVKGVSSPLWKIWSLHNQKSGTGTGTRDMMAWCCHSRSRDAMPFTFARFTDKFTTCFAIHNTQSCFINVVYVGDFVIFFF